MQNQDAAAAFVEDTMNRYALELENMFGDLGLSSLRSERLIEILREVLP
ncbi:MAG TPA: hypothetical protein PK390_05605 [Fervidobacterium nodosum]|nr:hypothetical protein [Fervidobacterium nodosum]